jgi:HSP20 family protein
MTDIPVTTATTTVSDGGTSNDLMYAHTKSPVNWSLHTGSKLMPRVDYLEHAAGVEISIEMPGMTKDNIKVEIDEAQLTITGQYEDARQEETKDRRYTLAERETGFFTRHLLLPDSIDPKSIKARLSGGLLTIVAAKDPELLPRSIEIVADEE